MTIAHKGLALISVPLVFVLAFVLLVARIERSNDEAQEWYLRSKEVIALTHLQLSTLVDAESGARGRIITDDPAYSDQYERSIVQVSETTRMLKQLVAGNPRQLAIVNPRTNYRSKSEVLG